MTLPEFSIRQSVLVNVLFVVCVVGGIAALSLTEVEYYHDVTLNQAVITTRWTGASADEVERLVTTKLEEELLTVSNVDEMRSASQAGVSMISIDFDETLDEFEYESAINDVRGALEQVEDLPPEADEPILREIITAEIAPVVFVAVTDVGGVGELAIRDVARELESRLREIPGVSTVEIRGLQDREVRVLVDRARADRYGITLSEIAERVRRQNQNLPGGTFQDATGEATLRAIGDYASLDEIRETVIKEDGPGTRVLVRDVATVERGLEKAIYVTRYEGKPAAVVSIAKKDTTDVRELIGRVDTFLAGFAPLVPEGVEVVKTLDSAAFVTPRIGILLSNLWTGGLLVLALLWFTIGFRNALLTIVGIPFSFLTAILFFPLFGISINSNTLIGMLLVSGMLVDDAIVVLENIYRKVEEGQPIADAVRNGANEVLWPVIVAVGTTVAAFLPLLLVGGTAGKFVSVLPQCVVLCLIASLFECLVILPVHYLDFGSRSAAGHAGAAPGDSAWARLRGFFRGLQRRVDGGFERVRGLYLAALAPVLAHRFAFSALFIAFLYLAWAASAHLRFELFPGDYSTINISLETPTDFSIDQTAELTRELEARLLAMPEEDVEDFNTIVGLAIDLNFDRMLASNLALIAVAIPQNEANQLRPQEVMGRITDDLQQWAKTRPDQVVSLRVEADPYGPPVGRPVEVRIQSEDFAVNKTIADEIKAHLATIPGVSGIDDNLEEGPREVRIALDAERAGRFGLTFEDVARALRAANDGIVASSFRAPAAVEDDDIRVLLAPEQRDGTLDLLQTTVRARDGQLVRLADVANLEVTRGYLAYRRVDGKRAVTVFADVDDDLATSVSVNRDLAARFADIRVRFPQVELIYGGEYQESNEAVANTIAAFPVSLLLVYMQLAALFRSYLQPLVVLAAIPIGFAGIVFGVGALGYTVSFNLLYASVGLAGVVVNDSLVMVDFINRARREGMPIGEALMQAGAVRLRPIVLTTLTTVLALMPMALGIQGSSKSYGPFAAAIAFGLAFAMVGTLFVVPLCYRLIDSLESRLRTLAARLRGEGSAGPVHGGAASERIVVDERGAGGSSPGGPSADRFGGPIG